jgi:trehalose 6-phosphate phosphatase
LSYILGWRRLWAFDFDGTISRIVPVRQETTLDGKCERMLRYLLSSPWNRVAVISSRALDDIVPRVPLPGLFVGGGSGLEWRLPEGARIGPDAAAEKQLSTNRHEVRALL